MPRTWKEAGKVYVSYQTRSLREDLKTRLKMVGVREGKSLEELLNRAIELGLPFLENRGLGGGEG